MAEGNSTARALRRYGPIAAVVALVVGVIVVVGGGGDDDDDGEVASGRREGASSSALPLTFQEAEEAGEDVDFGEGCDTERGRIAIPLNNAAPCVEPWEEGADNGGATSQGVTADSIRIVVYQGEPDPLQQALIGDAGADVSPEDNSQTRVDYLKMFEDVYETYGRTLDIQVVEATGTGSDATAAQADARRIIDLQPFAVIGGPAQTPVYWQEITNAGILCVGDCSLAEPWDVIEDAAPYLWPNGPAPEQADVHLAEMLGKQLVGGKAEFAGDPELAEQDRVFGWVQAETETGEYDDRVAEFDRVFEEDWGGEIAARSTYLFDPGAAQEAATAVIARMRDAGVTSVIMSVDPLVPAAITAEATKQGYFPEWIMGPSVLADTTIFGRTFDQQQWENAIGISLPAARADDSLSDSYFVYDWYYGEEVPTNTHGVQLPPPQTLMAGIHLAGPELTPETFAQGLFRAPVNEPGQTYTRVSRGEDLWGRPDYNGTDDVGAWWWDAEATGESEVGQEGVGMIRYMDGGTRYLPGEWPDEPLPFFEEEGSVTVYDELPEGDALPDYPAWPGSPASA